MTLLIRDCTLRYFGKIWHWNPECQVRVITSLLRMQLKTCCSEQAVRRWATCAYVVTWPSTSVKPCGPRLACVVGFQLRLRTFPSRVFWSLLHLSV